MVVYVPRREFEHILEQLIILATTSATDADGHLVGVNATLPEELEMSVLEALRDWCGYEYKLR